jgi:uncharacterized membrane protein YphA (DoxX/SURF4 family)
VFVAFGIGKFVNHAAELASFKIYGLPAPELFLIAIGVVELVGGLFLIADAFTTPTALVLAGDMVGAIVVSGIARGELISLTLAPVELVVMLAVLSHETRTRYANPNSRRRPRAIRGSELRASLDLARRRLSS